MITTGIFMSLALANPSIAITVTGLHSAKGSVECFLYKPGTGFPTKPRNAYRKERVRIKKGRAVCTFDDIKPGRYAVAAYHDEDNNGDMASNFLGIPTEGTAVSNNADGGFGPPDFDDASFVLRKRGFKQKIRMDY